MDGENNDGKPYVLMDDLGGKPTIFGNIQIGSIWDVYELFDLYRILHQTFLDRSAAKGRGKGSRMPWILWDCFSLFRCLFFLDWLVNGVVFRLFFPGVSWVVVATKNSGLSLVVEGLEGVSGAQ